MKLNKEFKQFRNSITITFLIIGIIFLIGTITLFVISYFQEQSGIPILANVIEVKFNDDKYVVKVNYKVEDKIYEQTLKSKQEVTVSDLYEIRYNKDNPNILVDKDYTIAISITSSITLISLAISLEEFISYMSNKKKKERLSTQGLKVNADIVEIYINNKAIPFRGKYPYKIRLEYLNPQDNKKYVFETENLYEDMKSIIESKKVTKLPVYIDSNNTYVYYIDLGVIE